MKIDGRCHCGFITYEAEIDPEKVMICHCTDCQSLSGSAFRTVAHTREGGFNLLSGELTIYVKIGGSGARRPQGFCPQCGSAIYATSEADEPKFIAFGWARVGSGTNSSPRAQKWCRSAQPWIDDIGAIPKAETN